MLIKKSDTLIDCQISTKDYLFLIEKIKTVHKYRFVLFASSKGLIEKILFSDKNEFEEIEKTLNATFWEIVTILFSAFTFINIPSSYGILFVTHGKIETNATFLIIFFILSLTTFFLILLPYLFIIEERLKKIVRL